MAALEVLRSRPRSGARPAPWRWWTGPTRRARGSGAACSAARRSRARSTWTPPRGLTDADGVSLADAVAAHGVDVDAMGGAGEGRRERLAAYLELHIEQGPVLEAEGLACGAVLGTFGVERHRAVFAGRPAHAGLDADGPPRRRRGGGGARHRRRCRRSAREHGGVCTAGRADFEPGIVTAVPGRAELLVDQRHLDPGALAAMRADARAGCRRGCGLGGLRRSTLEPIWRDRAGAVPRGPGRRRRRGVRAAAAGRARRLPSGALHDASELARVVPGGDGLQLLEGRRQPRAGGGHPRGRPRTGAGGLRRAGPARRGRRGAVKSVRVLVSGRVQGVGFRWVVQREAERVGVARVGAQPVRTGAWRHGSRAMTMRSTPPCRCAAGGLTPRG